MRIEEYQNRIYDLTKDRLDGSKVYNVKAHFKTIGKWAMKYYDKNDNNAIQTIQDKAFISAIENFMSFIDQSFDRINSYKKSLKERDKEHEYLVKFLRGYYNIETKRNSLEKWETYLVDVCHDYSICTFISYMLLSGSEAYRGEDPSPEKTCDPFQARSYMFFFSGKNSSDHTRMSRMIFWMFSNIFPKYLRKLMTYTKSITTIQDIFIMEWKTGIPDYCEYVNNNIIGVISREKASSEFIKIVDLKYPKLDVDIDCNHITDYEKINPVVYFMSQKKIYDRSRLLIDLLKYKGNDGHVATYIHDLLNKEREIQVLTNPYLKNYTSQNAYIQLMYETICRSGNMTLLKLFNNCISIEKSVKEPWSPLFGLNGFDAKIIKFNIDSGVDVNREHGILGRQFAQAKVFSGFMGFKSRADILNWLIKEKGFRIQDPGMYYLSAIENNDNRLLWYLFDYTDIRCDDDLPLRTALFFKKISIAEDIMEEYEDINDAIEVLKGIANMEDSPMDSKRTAKRILNSIKLDRLESNSKKKKNHGLINFK